MNATRRLFVAGSLLAFLAGCSGQTDSATTQQGVEETAAGPVNARELLASTLAEAQASNRRVFVHVGTPW